MRACVWWNAGSRARTITPLARHASRNALAGVPMFTNMKLAWQSVGFMPRSANHLVAMSRTALLRLRSLVVKLASLLDCDRGRRHAEHVQRPRAAGADPLPQLLDRVGVRDRVALAQARHPVRLREGARHDDARVLDRDRHVRLVIPDR